LTETFEEYLVTNNVPRVECGTCKIFLGYGEIDDGQYMLCDTCMRKEFEENKK